MIFHCFAVIWLWLVYQLHICFAAIQSVQVFCCEIVHTLLGQKFSKKSPFWSDLTGANCQCLFPCTFNGKNEQSEMSSLVPIICFDVYYLIFLMRFTKITFPVVPLCYTHPYLPVFLVSSCRLYIFSCCRHAKDCQITPRRHANLGPVSDTKNSGNRHLSKI